MNDNQRSNFPSLPTGLHVPRHKMSRAWQEVHDDLKAQGFVVAADNMADIMRLSSPQMYWKGKRA